VQQVSTTRKWLWSRTGVDQLPLAPPPDKAIRIQADFTAEQKRLADTWNEQGGLLEALSSMAGIEGAAAVAVLAVESQGRGFAPDGRMVIRFENHVFWSQWGKHQSDRFRESFRFDEKQRWRGHRFRNGDWVEVHSDQAREWMVFEFARTLDEEAAIRSTSLGAPQILGLNHGRIGYPTARQMFAKFQSDIRYQVLGLFDFLRPSMIAALRERRYQDFAARYNGPGRAAKYGEAIERQAEIFRSLQPDCTTMSLDAGTR